MPDKHKVNQVLSSISGICLWKAVVAVGRYSGHLVLTWLWTSVSTFTRTQSGSCMLPTASSLTRAPWKYVWWTTSFCTGLHKFARPTSVRDWLESLWDQL